MLFFQVSLLGMVLKNVHTLSLDDFLILKAFKIKILNAALLQVKEVL